MAALFYGDHGHRDPALTLVRDLGQSPGATRLVVAALLFLPLSCLSPPMNVFASESVCEVDQDSSLVQIRVYKEGRLSVFGDNHIISTSDLSGDLKLDRQSIEQSKISIEIPTRSLVVNDPRLRAAAEPEFNSRVSAFNQRITRKSMLGSRVLDAEKYPKIAITVEKIPQNLDGIGELEVELRGTKQKEQARMAVNLTGNRFTATGRVLLSQKRYGIRPFSILFGGIRVRNVLRLDFEITANCQ